LSDIVPLRPKPTPTNFMEFPLAVAVRATRAL
jgi:hypothetical protein